MNMPTCSAEKFIKIGPAVSKILPCNVKNQNMSNRVKGVGKVNILKGSSAKCEDNTAHSRPCSLKLQTDHSLIKLDSTLTIQ